MTMLEFVQALRGSHAVKFDTTELTAPTDIIANSSTRGNNPNVTSAIDLSSGAGGNGTMFLISNGPQGIHVPGDISAYATGPAVIAAGSASILD